MRAMNKFIITTMLMVIGFGANAADPNKTYKQPIAKISNSQLIIEQGDGWARILPNVPEYKKALEKAGDTDSQEYREADNFVDKELIAITTLGGLMNAGLNQEFVRDKLAEYGYGYPVSSRDFDRPFGPIVVDPAEIEYVYREGGTVTKGQIMRGSCSDSNSSKSFNLALTPQSFSENHSIGNNVNVDLDVGFGGTGNANLEVFYKKDRWGWGFLCATVGVDYRYHDIKVDAVLDNTHFNLSGDAQYAYSDTLYEKRIKFLSTGGDFWVWVVQFEWEINFGMDVQVDLDIEAQATLGYSATVDGNIHIDWRCEGANCEAVTPDVIEANINADESPTFGFQLDVTLTPSVGVFAEAQVDMFWGLFDLAKAGATVKALAPLRFHAYYGNTCGDGNGDGQNEIVQAALIDWYVYVYAYWYVQWGNGDIDMNQIGIELPNFVPDLSVETELSGTVPVWRKQLLFNDLLSSSKAGSNTLQPLMNFTSTAAGNSQGELFIAPRSCYPFDSTATYEIDWGDSVESVEVPSNGITVPHQWLTTGNKNVKVRLVSDANGRDFTLGYQNSRTVEVTNTSLPSCKPMTLDPAKIEKYFDIALQDSLAPGTLATISGIDNCINLELPAAQTGQTQQVTCDVSASAIDDGNQFYMMNYKDSITYICGTSNWYFSPIK